MRQYHDLMERILADGAEKHDRTGTGTLSVFGHQLRFDLADGFPITTTKKLHLKSIVHELLWFLAGDTNVKYLNEQGVTIWDEWADENGDLGRIYGAQWCDWRRADGRSINQIDQLHCQLYQRSADLFLGVPFNIASYSLLLMMVAQVCDLKLGTFVHTFGDLHLYANHLEQAKLQLTREPRPLPRMQINPSVKEI